MNYLEIASEQLRRDEGEQRHAYRDSEGYLTIGIGRLIDDRLPSGGLRPDEVTVLFENDLDDAVNDARRLVPTFDTLSETRKAVLVNMAFNLGYVGLSEFRLMLQAVMSGNYDIAAKEMLDSQWARQVGARAMRLAQQMKEGNTP